MKHMDYHLFPSIFISQGIIVQMCVSKVIKSELPSQWTHELARGLIYKRSGLLVHKVESPLIDALWCWTLEWEGLCFSGGPVVCFPYNSDLSSSCCSRQSRALHMHDTDDLLALQCLTYLVWPLCGSKLLLHMCGRDFEVWSVGFDLSVWCSKLLFELLISIKSTTKRVNKESELLCRGIH